MAAAATIVHTSGSRVWVKDDKESWVKAEVQKIENNVLIVALEENGELRKVQPEDAPLQNTDTRGVEVCFLLCNHASGCVCQKGQRIQLVSSTVKWPQPQVTTSWSWVAASSIFVNGFGCAAPSSKPLP